MASGLSLESLIKLVYSLAWGIMVLVLIQRRVYEWVTCPSLPFSE